MRSPEATELDLSRFDRLRGAGPVLVLGLVLTGVFALSDAVIGVPMRAGALFLVGFGCAFLWRLTAVWIWRLSQGLSLLDPPRLRAGLIHMFLSALFAVVMSIAFSPFVWWITKQFYLPEFRWRQALASTANYFLFAKVLFYWLVVSVEHAVRLARRVNERALETARVQEQLTQARLDVLRMQMQPHFLFNSLHSISALIHGEQPQQAARIVSRLGQVLRASLEEQDRAFAPLEVELSHLDHYLEIERSRFGDRLKIELDVPDEALATPVPRWILQPLVENAIRHGVEADPDAGWIGLQLRCDSKELRIVIEDDGPGPPAERQEGLGLGNTRERLTALYGDHARLELRRREPRGCRLELELPIRNAGESE